MSRDTVDGGLTLTGTITWFYLVKRFGFIVSDEKKYGYFVARQCAAQLLAKFDCRWL